MYHFAIVALLGLAIWKFVGMVLGFAGRDFPSHIRALLTLGLGVVTAYMLEYSIFSAWGVTVATEWVDRAFTGLIIGGMAYVVHTTVGLIEAYGRRNRDEARALESRPPRAA